MCYTSMNNLMSTRLERENEVPIVKIEHSTHLNLGRIYTWGKLTLIVPEYIQRGSKFWCLKSFGEFVYMMFFDL